MYRLPSKISLAFLLGMNAFAVAQESKPETSRSIVEAPADIAVAEKQEFAFTFLEEMPPANQALAPQWNSNPDVGLGVIDFDQVFTAIPDVNRFLGETAIASEAESDQQSHLPSGPVAVARIPHHPASVPQVSATNSPVPVAKVPVPADKVPVPADKVPVPVAQAPVPVAQFPVPVAQFPVPVAQFPVPVARVPVPVSSPTVASAPAPLSANAGDDQEPADPSTGMITIDSGVQATAAIEEIEEIEGIALEDAAVLRNDQTMPQTFVVDDNCAEPAAVCDTCNTTTHCKCKTNNSKWSCLTDWWHNTSLYRHHVHSVGQPGLFCERPFGACNEGFAAAMIVAGQADRAMLHHYDFVHHADGGVELTQLGHRELGRIAGIMAEFPVALSIESTLNPSQDGARRNAVLDAIARLGLPIAPDSVFVSVDRTIGLSGIDAQAIHTIRTNEAATGASRTRPYTDTSGATLIPFSTGNAGGESR